MDSQSLPSHNSSALSRQERDARADALVGRGTRRAKDVLNAGRKRYSAVLADLVNLSETELSTVEGVFQKAYMELFHRHEEDRMGNLCGENAKDALRVRFWMETKDQDPGDAETFEELMHIVNKLIESDDPDRPVFEDEAVHLGDLLDVII